MAVSPLSSSAPDVGEVRPIPNILEMMQDFMLLF